MSMNLRMPKKPALKRLPRNIPSVVLFPVTMLAANAIKPLPPYSYVDKVVIAMKTVMCSRVLKTWTCAMAIGGFWEKALLQCQNVQDAEQLKMVAKLAAVLLALVPLYRQWSPESVAFLVAYLINGFGGWSYGKFMHWVVYGRQ